MRAGRLLVALLALVLVACGSSGEEPSPRPSTVARPAFGDQHLRPVRMTSGRALGYVQPETASQILCQLLDKAGWTRLLRGDIGRKPLNAPDAGCQIATERGMFSMRMVARDTAFEATTTTAGRPSTVEKNSFGQPVITLALSDDARQPAPRRYYPVRRLLEVELVGDDAAFGARVLGTIVPMLMKDAALPAIDNEGHVQYTGTPLSTVDEFVDLPRPVQALQLCTALLERLHVTATRTDVRDTGSCELGTADGAIEVAAQHRNYPADYPKQVAGRPAWAPDDPPVVRVLLRDDADVDLYVSAPDSMALAEELVPLLVG